MRLHDRGVDEHLRRRSASRSPEQKDVRPYALGCPSDEAAVEHLARSAARRRADTGPEDMAVFPSSMTGAMGAEHWPWAKAGAASIMRAPKDDKIPRVI